jgi:Delta7-sterol 5-desaturase
VETEQIAHSFAFYGFAFFGIILIRYFVLAGGTHLFLYGIFSRSGVDSDDSNTPKHRLSPPWKSIRRDIKLSILSSIIFALAAALIVSAYDLGITRLYADVDRYPLWYLGISYLVVIVLQDTYFYFLHRLFHHPLLFRWWHQGHHQSHQPTPWTSFAFDPPEAIVQSLFLVAIVFIVPLHLITVIAILITMTVWAVVNHLGIERLPTYFPHQWCSKYFTGPAHHAIHHRQYTLHYGLYFTFWDRKLGTESHQYKQDFIDLTHENLQNGDRGGYSRSPF